MRFWCYRPSLFHYGVVRDEGIVEGFVAEACPCPQSATLYVRPSQQTRQAAFEHERVTWGICLLCLFHGVPITSGGAIGSSAQGMPDFFSDIQRRAPYHFVDVPPTEQCPLLFVITQAGSSTALTPATDSGRARGMGAAPTAGTGPEAPPQSSRCRPTSLSQTVPNMRSSLRTMSLLS